MATPEIRDYIDRFIKFKATDKVIAKGKDLYNEGRVNLTYKNDASDAWHFNVQGSQKYTVIIKDLNKKDAKTKCSCPFEWSTICKHTVASLLFIADANPDINAVNQNEQKELTHGSIRTAIGYRFENYRLLTIEEISNNTSRSIANEIRQYFGGILYKGVKISNDEIVFEYSDYGRPVSVVIRYRNEKVYVSSDNSTGTPRLNKVEARTLCLIAESQTPDMLYTVFNEGLEKVEKETLKRYGFDENTNFSDYFAHAFHPENGLTVVYKDGQTGLIPIEPKFKHNFLSFIDDVNNETLHLDKIPRSSDEMKLGFVIEMGGESDDDYYDRYSFVENDFELEIYPITGKPNKQQTLLVSHFKKYDAYQTESKVIVTDNAQKIIDELEKLEGSTDEKKSFICKRNIINGLCNERFVYLKDSGEYNLRKTDLQPVIVSKEPIDATYSLYEDETFVGLSLDVHIGETKLDGSILTDYAKQNHLYLKDNTFYMPKNYLVARHIANWNMDVKMVKTHKDKFINDVLLPLSLNFEINLNGVVDNLETLELDFKSKQVYLSEQYDYLIISPQVEYHHGVSVQLSHNGNVLVPQEEGLTEYVRNFDLENDFIEAIAALHPNFEEQKDDKRFFLHYDDFTKNMWFYKFFDEMQSQEVEVFGLKELKNFKYSPYKGKVSTTVASGQDWFEVDVKVTFGNNSIGLKDIRKAILNKQKYVQLSDGSVGLLPKEWYHKLEKYFRHGEIVDNKLAVSKLRFSIIDELFDEINDMDIINEIGEKRKRLSQFKEITNTQVPQEITAELRPYQKEGLNWLNFLDEMGWGGILADDMGLGKTLQILTFLQHVTKKDTSPNLIIVPTTLLFNWQNEIEKFAPELKAYYHYGINREKDISNFNDYHLVFTSYGVLLRDVQFLKEFQFNYLILDESQAIKNPASRRFKAVNVLKSKNRIALSGTPIENSTFDLYAQMSFVNRGFFGGVTAFKENYSNMIDKEGNDNIAAELQRLINPFILRRTKERVASELPPKTEGVIYCEMEKEQRKVYDAYRNEFKNKLLGNIETEGMGKSKLMVLEALTRLRQICDSPVLLNDDNINTNESVKIKEIVQHITDKTAKHKILIFSQFVKMLGLVRDELTKRNIAFEYLDGQSTTTQRERSVNNFQDNDELRVFLISLKAGGTGLNLTAADYVYILDPWWNPAVENQAIDRCYRIGQDKKVFAYRMICKDTVEEKILNLQTKKKKIAGDIVQTDENIMKTLQADDIRQLFS